MQIARFSNHFILCLNWLSSLNVVNKLERYIFDLCVCVCVIKRNNEIEENLLQQLAGRQWKTVRTINTISMIHRKAFRLSFPFNKKDFQLKVFLARDNVFSTTFFKRFLFSRFACKLLHRLLSLFFLLH